MHFCYLFDVLSDTMELILHKLLKKKKKSYPKELSTIRIKILRCIVVMSI